jgi:predicted nucleic acid-binding protein
MPTFFRKILMPPVVASELASSKRPPKFRAFIAARPSSRRILTPSSTERIHDLDAGETPVITLAMEVHAGRLLIDEYRGCKAAAERGLRAVGTVGVLELAAEMGSSISRKPRVKRTDLWISHTWLDERLALFLRRKPVT